MSSPSKVKGNRFERECVERAEYKFIEAQRFWGSDGRSAGYHKDADIKVDDWLFQCKIRKQLPKWLQIDWNEVDGFLIRQDRGKPLVMIDYDDFLDLIKERGEWKKWTKRNKNNSR